MPLRIVYVHGWGLDASLWTPIRRLGVMDDFAVDLGFTGTVGERVPFPDTPYVAVGHSMGLAWHPTHCAELPSARSSSSTAFPSARGRFRLRLETGFSPA